MGKFSKQNSREFIFLVNETCLVTVIVQHLHGMNSFCYDFKTIFWFCSIVSLYLAIQPLHKRKYVYSFSTSLIL